MSCPYKRTEKTNCLGRDVSCGMNATAVCNFLEERHWQVCGRYYREASLAEIKPKLFCCMEMQQLFHECAEDSGCLAGSFDIRLYPNDGKDMWRNYRRIRFIYCPFCGTRLVAS